MTFGIRFSEEKNQLLKATRGVGFEEILSAVETGGLLADIFHPSQQHSNQRLYVVKVKDYAYGVPYVIDTHKQEIFLKTVYPSRALTRIYLQGGKGGKK